METGDAKPNPIVVLVMTPARQVSQALAPLPKATAPSQELCHSGQGVFLIQSAGPYGKILTQILPGPVQGMGLMVSHCPGVQHDPQ